MAGLWYNCFGKRLTKLFADMYSDLFAYKKETNRCGHVSLDMPSYMVTGALPQSL